MNSGELAGAVFDQGAASFVESLDMEQLRNNPASTLTADISGSDTVLTVADASTFALVAPFTIRIESELLRVTGVSGSDFTVTRGTEGTAATGHLSGVAVIGVVTAGVLDILRAEMYQVGPMANRPSLAREGTVYAANDANYRWRYRSGGWDIIYPTYSPHEQQVDISSWPVMNSGLVTCTYDKGINTLTMGPKGSAGRVYDGFIKSIPSAPFYAAICIGYVNARFGNHSPGIAFFDSGVGNFTSLCTGQNTGGPGVIYSANFTSDTTTRISTPSNSFTSRYHRLRDDGTFWYYESGVDGATWTTYYRENRNTNLTATHIAIVVAVDNAAGTRMSNIIRYWEG